MQNGFKTIALTLLVSLLAPAAYGGSAPSSEVLPLSADYGRISAHCKKTKAQRHVWLFKQWHLPAVTRTREKTDFSGFSQEKNQTAIYKQLAEWIEAKKIDEIYAEGCSGELKEGSPMEINGWKISDLKTVISEPYFPQIISSVPLKLEAKFGATLKTVCGDDEDLIKRNSLAFSDARAAIGFLMRLAQQKDNPQLLQPTLAKVIALYHLPEGTSAQVASLKLKAELKAAVARAKTGIEKRNEKLISALKKSKRSQTAVIFGGAHAPGIVKLLDQAGIACTVVEPTGYQDDEAQIVQKLDELIMAL